MFHAQEQVSQPYWICRISWGVLLIPGCSNGQADLLSMAMSFLSSKWLNPWLIWETLQYFIILPQVTSSSVCRLTPVTCQVTEEGCGTPAACRQLENGWHQQWTVTRSLVGIKREPYEHTVDAKMSHLLCWASEAGVINSPCHVLTWTSHIAANVFIGR